LFIHIYATGKVLSNAQGLREGLDATTGNPPTTSGHLMTAGYTRCYPDDQFGSAGNLVVGT
jgi:hypothetical protein